MRRNKHVKLGNNRVKVLFTANSFKASFGVRSVFKSLIVKNSWILLQLFLVYIVCKYHIG